MPPPPGIVRIDITPAHRIQSFRPLEALGSTVDKEPAGSIPRLYSKKNVQAMLDAGWGWLSYRLFTELSDQDWHWNPAGTFSAGDRGYWTSTASTKGPAIADSFGYRLKHRGNESDQGNNENYSRLDDGDLNTYWKSDPYLSHEYTGDADADHPQWVVVDLGAKVPLNEITIDWANPFAKQYVVSYWTGADAIGDPANGKWLTFAFGTVTNGAGGRASTRLSSHPIKAQFVRVLMTQSSGTCDSHGSSDRRNCMGYAIAELGIGLRSAGGAFHDLIKHAACAGAKTGPYACSGNQTATYTSSTDPWHTFADRVRNQEQPGLDLIARSGLTRGLGAMYPVPMLYSTPENAVNEVRYLKARGYSVSHIELGEEPDGQYTLPEDYAALYVEWARALHAYDPSLKLGGPVLSGVNSDLQTWPDAQGNVSWLNRFLSYLRSHRSMNQLSFMSFEHYPFGGCDHGTVLMHDLLTEPSVVKTVVDAWRADGLPRSVPMFITEANFSSVNFAQTPMQIEGALWQADYMASALANGVSKVVYYQYEPVPLSQNKDCPADWGNLTMFAADGDANIHARTAQFFAGDMLMHRWVAPGNGIHEVYPSSADLIRNGNPLVTTYALKRPDGLWSVLLVNKDQRPHQVEVEFDNGRQSAGFAGRVTHVTFGSAQYVWRSRGAASLPDPNEPPEESTVDGGPHALYTIPALSITVLRGAIR
jgi:F5/8 type C domain-containing protein